MNSKEDSRECVFAKEIITVMDWTIGALGEHEEKELIEQIETILGDYAERVLAEEAHDYLIGQGRSF